MPYSLKDTCVPASLSTPKRPTHPNALQPEPCSKTLDEVRAKLENFDQKIGVQIIQNALRVPMKTIASNAGVEGAVIVGKVCRAGKCGWMDGRKRGRGQAGRTQVLLPQSSKYSLRCISPIQVLEYTDPNMGYDAATAQFTDMIKAGIIDPLKV